MDDKSRVAASAKALGAGSYDWPVAAKDPQFQQLVAIKMRRIRPAIVIYVLAYLGVSALVGFVPAVSGIKVVGSFTLGFLLILLTYVVAWLTAVWYARVARNHFDPLQQAAVQSICKNGGAL